MMITTMRRKRRRRKRRRKRRKKRRKRRMRMRMRRMRRRLTMIMIDNDGNSILYRSSCTVTPWVRGVPTICLVTPWVSILCSLVAWPLNFRCRTSALTVPKSASLVIGSMSPPSALVLESNTFCPRTYVCTHAINRCAHTRIHSTHYHKYAHIHIYTRQGTQTNNGKISAQ